jgi:hypothetical protein
LALKKKHIFCTQKLNVIFLVLLNSVHTKRLTTTTAMSGGGGLFESRGEF